MASNKCRLIDIADVQGGFAFKSSDFRKDGVPVIKIANIQPPQVTLHNVDCVAFETVRGLDRFRLSDGDILMAMTGATVGKVGRFTGHETAYLNQRVARISSKYGREYDDYIFAVVSLPGFDRLIEGSSAGSAQANISATGIGSVSISRHSAAEQLQIGRIARALDDRVRLLRETNQMLEAVARAIFKSWFVDFDPVRAKGEGREPEGMDAATAALFPNEFQGSILGEIPADWGVGRLDDLLVLQRGFDLPHSQRTPGSYPVIAASGPSGTHCESRAKGPGVVTGRSGVLGNVFWVDDDFWPLNTSLWVKEFKRAKPAYAVQHLRTLDLSSYNAGSAVPTLNRNHIHSLPTLLPPTGLVEAFDEIATPLFQKIRANKDHSENLIELRDLLLPRLITGKLRVPEAEKLVEAII